MDEIRNYQDLRVWQTGMDLAEQAYLITKPFPREELFGMTSQIRRAASSIPANIAEGWGRGSTGDYIRFLRIAQGSLKEVETHLLLSKRVNLTTQPQIAPLMEKCTAIGKMLTSLIGSLQRKLGK